LKENGNMDFIILLPVILMLSLSTPALIAILRATSPKNVPACVLALASIIVVATTLWPMFKQHVSLRALNVSELSVALCWTLLHTSPRRDDPRPRRIQFELRDLLAGCTCVGVSIGVARWQLWGYDNLFAIVGVPVVVLLNVVGWIVIERNDTSPTFLGLLLLGLNAVLFASTVVLWRSDDVACQVIAGLLIVSALQGFIAVGCAKVLLRAEQARMLNQP
jgi:hypothetical protein